MKLTLPIILTLLAFFTVTAAVTLESTNVVAKCWFKYFVFYPTENQNAPRAFFINPAYAEQKASGFADMSLKDEFGFVDVPGEFEFFMTLTREAIFITTARRNDMVKTVDAIYLHSLAKQTSIGANY